MRQHISRLAVGLFLTLFASQSMAAGSHKYQEYRKFLQTTMYPEVAMWMDANGMWWFYPGVTVGKAKFETLHVCKKRSKRPETCKVVDVSGVSAWWRGGAKGNPASSSYVPPSSNASALVPKGPTQLVASSSSNTVFHERECEEVFKTQWHIDRPVSPFAGNWDNNCWDYISKDGQTWIGSNKSGFSSTASSSSSGGSSSNTVFHESECKEVWQKYGSGDAISKSYNATTTQQWDMKCWGYVSKDGKRWIGSKSGRSSTVAQVPTTKEIELAQSIETKKLDLEFWQSVKDSNDAEMYSEYLRQFPRGVYAGLARIKLKKLGVVPTKSSIPNLDYGRYHALVIGNDRYRHLKKLSTAVNDAKSIASLLHSQYGFEVNVLTNATRNETVSALSELRQKISPKDNLLVYYAGHGWLDKAMDEGFWLPVDAVEDNPVEWLSNATVVGMVRAMKAKHVMVVADSCFSGTLVRGLKIKERSPDYIQRMVKKKARTALTSGGLEPVTDVGGGNHSVFAQSFMRILNENDGVLDGHQLFTTLRRQVMMGADQTPEYGDIRKAGHDGGDFLFVRQ